MLYLDANVFVYAAINTEEAGKKARALLQKIQQGEERAATSALTFDEVFWSIKKRAPELALGICQAMLAFPNLDIVAVDKELAQSALKIINEYNLAPRDAIHAAAAMAQKTEWIISTDRHFDKLKELKRKPP
jgi:predicted nucleic acid-binding protein